MAEIYVSELISERKKCEDRIVEINKIITELKKKKIENCKHIWIKEREPGQYGELWTYCKNCRIDYHCRDWIH